MGWLDRLLEQWTRRHTRAALGIAALVGAGLAFFAYEVVQVAKVVPDVIRVDFDDLIGVDLIGLAAVITAVAGLIKVVKTNKTVRENGWVEKHHHDQLEERVRLLEEGRTGLEVPDEASS